MLKDRAVRGRFWVEVALASVTGGMLLITFLWKDWIEIVFHVDPDNHSGSLEWTVVTVALVVTVMFVGLARREWRTSSPGPVSESA